MNASRPSTVRRDLKYLLLCGLGGFAVLPAILTVVGSWLIHRGAWSPEVWPASLSEGYLGFFSLMWLRIQLGHLLLPLAEILVCFLVPYALFQLTRWTVRGMRFIWTRHVVI